MTNTATATEFNREPSKVLKRVERGETVVIEKHGQPSAVLIPQPGITSGTKLARRLRRMKPQPEAAREVERAIRMMDEAD